MPTAVLQVNPDFPDPDIIRQAAQVLIGGGLVAFPTETVYGLGANALDAVAVGRIFTAKGRPPNNPLIVHVSDSGQARELVTAWPPSAQQLSVRFWPGPLTMVLPKAPGIPDIVTAKGPTVAVRVPAHNVALALLRACKLPLAAPSANRSARLSPTRAEHVLRGLGGRIDLILDAGPTLGGLESTVVDLATSPPRLLRPGLVALPDIENAIGPILSAAGQPAVEDVPPLRSPGLLGRHYAPRAPLEVAGDDGAARVAELRHQGFRVGWVRLPPAPADDDPLVLIRVLPDQARGYAAQLYATLHSLDEAGVDRIVVARPPDGPQWQAIRDRLHRAAQL